MATTTTTPPTPTVVSGSYSRTFEVALTGDQNVTVECPTPTGFSDRITLSGNRTQTVTFPSAPSGPCILRSTVFDPPVTVPPLEGRYDLAHWAYSIRPKAFAMASASYIYGSVSDIFYDIRENPAFPIGVSTVSANDFGALADRPTIDVPISGTSGSAAVTFTLTSCTWGTAPGGAAPRRACKGILESVNDGGAVLSGLALAGWRYIDGGQSIGLPSGAQMVTVVSPDNRPLSLSRPTGSEAILEFKVDLKHQWNTNDVALVYPEFTCLLAGTSTPSQSTFPLGSLRVLSVVPGTTCRFNMVSINAVRSRTGRVGLRRTLNGVTTELPVSEITTNSYAFTVGGPGSKTVLSYSFEYDQPTTADFVLDTFSNGSIWSTWFGTATSAIDGWFTGSRPSLHVVASAGTRAVKMIVDVTGRGPKLELDLAVFANPTATIQIYDANWRLLRSEDLTFGPSAFGAQRSAAATTIELPVGAARMLIGVASANDFGIDSLRITNLGGVPPTTTTVPASTTTTSTTTIPVTTTTMPSTTVPVGTKIATKIAWTTVPVGCGVKFDCAGYVGRVESAGNLISDALTYPPAVETVTTPIKPGFSKVSATYAGNATYAPSSGTREIRIPQASVQIVSGTTEGSPLLVRVSLTDPETGAPTKAFVTSVVATSTVQGATGAGAGGSVVDGVGTFSLSGLKAGDYIVTVRVPDAVGFVIFTNFTLPVRIRAVGVTTTTVPPTTTTPPTTTPSNSTKTISSPVNNSAVVGPAIKLQINNATNVARVDWFINGIPLGTDITPADPLTWNAQGSGSGPFTLKAVVVDASFKESTTQTVLFSIR